MQLFDKAKNLVLKKENMFVWLTTKQMSLCFNIFSKEIKKNNKKKNFCSTCIIIVTICFTDLIVRPDQHTITNYANIYRNQQWPERRRFKTKTGNTDVKVRIRNL